MTFLFTYTNICSLVKTLRKVSDILVFRILISVKSQVLLLQAAQPNSQTVAPQISCVLLYEIISQYKSWLLSILILFCRAVAMFWKKN